MTDETITIESKTSFRNAFLLAILADALQLVIFPLFAPGAMSPADDVLDLAVGAIMVQTLGWHWEFLPSFLGKLVPGVDLVPFWTLAVANVYRKSRKLSTQHAENPAKEKPPLTIEGEFKTIR